MENDNTGKFLELVRVNLDKFLLFVLMAMFGYLMSHILGTQPVNQDAFVWAKDVFILVTGAFLALVTGGRSARRQSSPPTRQP